MTKYVYLFHEGNKDMRNLLGGKGANLAEMTNLGLPVPKGFTVTTEACTKYYDDGERISEDIEKEIFTQLEALENETGKKFGDNENPLLVSVRSGARASMPGMMDTILNLGLTDQIAETLANKGNPRFVYDSYRRLISMFADVVMGYDKDNFEHILEDVKAKKGTTNDLDLDAIDMLEVSRLYKEEYKRLNGDEFPQDPRVQLMEAVKAVFRSWNNDRANVYRKMNDIPYSWGTAVNVQEMVYGNLGENSGTGVAFTRNPATGEKVLYGEYLMNAQGEDVVAGVRTPQPIATLEEGMPEVYKQFVETAATLENHYKDMQDMEFTIENGKLFMLQTRNGKRTAAASIKIALDLIDEGMITKEEAVLRVEPGSLDQLLHPMFDAEALKNGKVIARGLAASPGAATGRIYFNAEDASKHTEAGEDTILVRLETSPEDIQGMHDAKGILTIRGGMTSHAAVVARGMGRCCVCGCGELTIDEKKKKLVSADGLVLKEGDYVSLNGSTGEVYGEEIKTVEPAITGDFERFMEIVDSVRKLKVYANADTPTDARQAIKFGAEGIGLVRTEHMFFNDDRIFSVRKMITAPNVEKRKEALAELLEMQRGDFEELFRVMEGHPMTIRYLDPPLHEFLPKEEKEIKSLAKSLGMSFDELKERIESLKEFNPMMGHRGCRLDITYPEIAEMQTRAVIEAALNVTAEGINVTPEIMIPLVGDVKELHYVKELVDNTAKEVMEEKGKEISYKVGTMIEVPRAALLSGQLAKEAEFFSFGTNDLTQMTFGFSRDDAAKFLNDYYDKKIFEQDPFAKLDETGVGRLMEIAIYQARNVKENIKLGICGEHAGNPASIKFCKQIGLNYVSCSPFRVPVARLAAAQAEIETNDK